MNIDWGSALKTGAGVVIIYCWCIFMLEVTFSAVRENKKRQMITWVATGTGVFALVTAGTILADIVFEWAVSVVANDAGTLLVILFLSIVRLIPMMAATIASVVTARFAYSGEKATKTFAAILLGLGTIIIDSYLAPMTELFFMGKNVDLEEMIPAPVPAYLLLRVVWVVVIYLLYKKFIHKHLQSILNTPDGGMDNFVKVPVLSCITLGITQTLMSSFDLNYDSFLFLNRSYWVVAIGALIAVYAMMYWSIFRAITLSTQSMKTKAELDVASNIQASVLPRTFPAFPERSEFDIYASMDPAKEVGGDFYDFFMVDEEHLAVVIADVSGKGIPAALFMMSARTMIKNQCMNVPDPGKIFSVVNNQLIVGNDESMFVTAFLGVLNLKTGEMVCANAGHNPPYIVRADGSVEQVKVRAGFVLAGMEGIKYRNHTLNFSKGDKLVLYTDGVTEAVNPQWELYGESRLEEVLKGTESVNTQTCIEKITASLEEFGSGAEQADDITMLVVELK